MNDVHPACLPIDELLAECDVRHERRERAGRAASQQGVDGRRAHASADRRAGRSQRTAQPGRESRARPCGDCACGWRSRFVRTPPLLKPATLWRSRGQRRSAGDQSGARRFSGAAGRGARRGGGGRVRHAGGRGRACRHQRTRSWSTFLQHEPLAWALVNDAPSPTRPAATTLNPMHICFLDIDGTLVSTGGAGQAAFVVTLDKDFGIQNASSSGVSFAGRSDRAIAIGSVRAARHRADAGDVAAVSRGLRPAARRSAARSTTAACCRASSRCWRRSPRAATSALGLITGNVAPGGRAQAPPLRALGLVSRSAASATSTPIAATSRPPPSPPAAAHLNGSSHIASWSSSATRPTTSAAAARSAPAASRCRPATPRSTCCGPPSRTCSSRRSKTPSRFSSCSTKIESCPPCSAASRSIRSSRSTASTCRTSRRCSPSGALENDRRFALVDADGRYVNGKRTAADPPAFGPNTISTQMTVRFNDDVEFSLLRRAARNRPMALERTRHHLRS